MNFHKSKTKMSVRKNTLNIGIPAVSLKLLRHSWLRLSVYYVIFITLNLTNVVPVHAITEDTTVESTTIDMVDVTTDSPYCPAGYILGYADNCYKFSTDPEWWIYSRNDCTDEADSDLVIVNDQMELDYLVTNVVKLAPNDTWWIGFYDISVEDTWRWVDCNYTNSWHDLLWAPGQPDNNGQQDCAVVDASGLLYDEMCDQVNLYICEISPKGFTENETNAKNVEAEAFSSTTIDVRWEVSPYNCDLIGYIVRYYAVNDPTESGFQNVYGGDSNNTTLTDLKVYTNYAISVAGLTTEKELDLVGPIIVETLLCPDGFERGPNDRCYYFSRGDTYWHSARGGCQSVADTDLLILDNQEEVEYIRNRTAAINPNSTWWIGYYDVSVEGVWKWVDCGDSGPWHEDLWGPGQPDNNGEQDCAVMSDNGDLYDEVCDEYNYRYICEVTPKEFDGNETNARNVQAEAISSSSIMAMWDISPYNCDVFGYRVHYYAVNDPEQKGSVSVFGGNATSAILLGLLPETEYAVSVAGLTIDEELEQVGPVIVETLLCPDGFERGPNDRCYYFSRGDTYWHSARGGCQSVADTDLLILDNQEEVEYIRNRTAAINPNSTWWIGYYDVSVEGVWKWVDCGDSEPWHEDLWGPGQPDNNGEQDCAVMGDNGDLYDEVCDEYNYRYICEVTPKEFDGNETNARNVQAVAVSSSSIMAMWDISPYNCDVFGYRVHYYAVNDPEQKGSVSVFGGNATSAILSGLLPETEYAVSVAGLTIDEELEQVGPVIVETLLCPDGFERGPNDRCYYFSRGDTYWHSARGGCQSVADTDLLILDNQEEVEYIRNRTAAINSNSTWWIGYYDVSVEGVWKWVDCGDSEPWHEDLWAPGQPDNNGEQDCAVMGDNGDLYDEVCDEYNYRYICEVTPKEFDGNETNARNVQGEAISSSSIMAMWDISPYNCDVFGYRVHYYAVNDPEQKGSVSVFGGNATSAILSGLLPETEYAVSVAGLTIDEELEQVGPVIVETLLCPDGFERGPNDRCYYFSRGDTYWHSARGGCQSVADTDLLILDNQEEVEYIRNRTAAINPNSTWWIGYYDVSVEDVWKWVDCGDSEPWHADLWAPGQPDNNGEQDCAVMGDNGELYDEVCDEYNYRYICEVTPKEFDGNETNARNIQAEAISSSSIMAMWDISPYNCDVFGYRVHYYAVNDPEQKGSVSVFGGNATSAILSGLLPETEYAVSVAGLTIDEELEQVGPVIVETLLCPDGFERGPNDRCYYFSRGDTYWHSARGGCQSVADTDLLILDNQEEVEYIRNRTAAINPNSTWWIGYYDVSVEGVWKWVDCGDSEPWHEDLWGPGQPDNNGEQDCAVMGDNGDLYDEVCDEYNYRYICEVSPKEFDGNETNARNVQGEAISSSSIMAMWDISPYNCDVFGYRVHYYAVNDPEQKGSVSVFGGNTTSAILSGLLPETEYAVSVAGLTIDEELEQVGPVIVETLLCPDGFERGPNDRCYYFSRGDTYWHSARGGCQSVADTDLLILDNQEEVEYIRNRTAAINPNSTWWIGYYDVSVEGVWKWVDCGDSEPWHEDLWGPGQPDNNGEQDCAVMGDNGDLYDEVCDVYNYRYICEVTPKEFDGNETNARNVQAEAVSSSSIMAMWNISPYNCDVFGYRVHYYAVNDPEQKGSVSVFGGNATSAILSGLLPESEYAVSVAGLTIDEELEQVGPVIVETLLCPDGFERGPNNRCYYFSRGDTYWHSARGGCQSVADTDLLILDNHEEVEYIRNRTAAINPNSTWWIGYYDVSVEGVWKWVDCGDSEPWHGDLWGPGQPDNNGEQDCAVMGDNGDLYDEVCDEYNYRYICEVTPKEFDGNETNARNVQAEAVSSSSIMAMWDISPYNCDVFGYRVHYYAVNDPEQKGSVSVFGGNATSAILSGLLPETEYAVSVAGLTIDEELEQVGPVIVVTLLCPDGFERGPNDRCYYFSRGDTYWHSARGGCQSVADTDLLILDNQEEVEYIRNRTAAINPNSTWWIGYYDVSVEGVWKWVDCGDSEPWHGDLWGPGQPDNNGEQDCAVMGDNGDLYDEVCDEYNYRYICEVTPKEFDGNETNARNVQAEAVSSSSIMAMWDISPYNCDVFGYRVHYYAVNDPEQKGSVSVFVGNATSAILSGLLPETEYAVSVAGLTIDEELEQVGPVIVVTLLCPDGFERGPNDICYYFSRGDTYWHSARGGCQSVADTDLLILDNQEEVEYIRNRTAAINPNSTWWIGYYDVSVEGVWKWVDCGDSEPWHGDLWAPGQPDNNGEQDCAVMGDNGDLYDEVCDEYNYRYICEVTPKEFDGNETNARNVQAEAVSSSSIMAMWDISPYNCDVFGYRVHYYAVNDLEQKGSVSVFGGNATSAILSGLLPETEYAVSVAGLTIDEELEQVGPVIVETLLCPDGFERGPNNRCYYFSRGNTYWHSARGGCQSVADTDLLILDNQEEVEYIRNRTAAINPNSTWWIGYYDVSVEGVWKWVDCGDSDPWHGDLWGPGQPDNNGEQDCAVMGDNGDLYDEVCDEYNYRYICEVTPKEFDGNETNARNVQAEAISSSSIMAMWDISPYNCDVFGYRVHYYAVNEPEQKGSVSVFGGNATSAILSGLLPETEYTVSVAGLTIDEELEQVGPVIVETLLCPDGFERGPNDRCYYFSRGDTYWHSARGGCQSVADTDLLILDNQEEVEYIRNRTAAINPNSTWWIGYYDVSVEGVWKWVDCGDSEPWHGYLWGPGQPDNNGEQDCAVMGDNGYLYDEVCDEYNYRYICEITPKEFDGNETNARNVQAEAISSSSIMAMWDISPYNCDVFGYRVHYYAVNDLEQEGSVSVFGGNATSAVVLDLLPETKYAVSVAGLTIDEELEQVGPVIVETLLCPDGFERGPNDRCYYFSRGYTYWHSARGGCQSVADTDLLILDNQEEVEYIRNRTAAINPNSTWWIGYYDVSVEGVWKWVDCGDSEPWHEDLWGPGQPDNNGEQDCAVMGDNGDLYDEVCDEYNYRYICEVTPKEFDKNETNASNIQAEAVSSSSIMAMWDISPYNCDVFGYRVHYYAVNNPEQRGSVSVFGGNVTSAVLTELQAGTEYAISVAGLTIDEELEQVGPVIAETLLCPDGFERGPNDRCYYFSRGDTYWHSARGGCQSVADTDLLILDNQEEVEYIRNRTAAINPNSTWWIGYYDVSVEGVWKWVDCGDSDPWHGDLWGPGQPDNNGEQDCAVMGDNGDLYDEVCDEYNYRYICEVTPKDFFKNDTNVRNVAGEALTPRSIEVRWEVSPYNCDVFGYRVHYYREDEPEEKDSLSVFGGNVSSTALMDLQFSTVYAISVAGLTIDEELNQVGPVLVETPVDPCGVREITEDTIITSPGYPSPYPDDQHCEWYITFPSDMYVLLQFEEFETERGYDIVTVGDGLEISPETAVLYLSGSKSSSEEIPEKYLNGGSMVWMTFDSSVHPSSPAGFVIQVSMVDVGPSEPEREYLELSGMFGEFYSPGWPFNYENNQDITWTVSVTKPNAVRLMFSQLNLEQNVDFIVIGSGAPDDNELERLTGAYDTYGPITSQDSQMWVRFISDETVTGIGFMISWAQVEGDEGNQCGTTEIDLPSGILSSPSYPDPYPNDQNCIWLITLPDDNAVVRLEFSVFETEAGHDFLLVGVGNIVDENILVSFSGSDSYPVTSATNEMWLRFVSDGSISKAGFLANFNSQGGTPSTTPVQIEDESVVIIVIGQTVGWFNVERQEALANGIADSLNVYCEEDEQNCGLEIGINALDVFSATDVSYTKFQNIAEDLHITVYVRNPTSSPGAPSALPQEVLQVALTDQEEQLEESLGPHIDLSITLPVPVTSEPRTGVELEVWMIGLIAGGCGLVVLIIIGVICIRKCRRSSSSKFNLQAREDGDDYFDDDSFDDESDDRNDNKDDNKDDDEEAKKIKKNNNKPLHMDVFRKTSYSTEVAWNAAYKEDDTTQM